MVRYYEISLNIVICDHMFLGKVRDYEVLLDIKRYFYCYRY